METGNLFTFTPVLTPTNCNCPPILSSSPQLFGGFYGSEKHAKFYSAGVVCAFEHLHERHIIYRDLKPENLLLNEKGHLKVTGGERLYGCCCLDKKRDRTSMSLFVV